MTLRILLITLLTGIILAVCTNPGLGENWLEVSKEQNGTVTSIDEDRIKISSGTIEFWTSRRYGDVDREREYVIAFLKNIDKCDRCETLYKTLILSEIRCADFMYRITAMTHYDSDGRVLHQMDMQHEWSHIIPGTVSNFVRNKYCP